MREWTGLAVETGLMIKSLRSTSITKSIKSTKKKRKRSTRSTTRLVARRERATAVKARENLESIGNIAVIEVRGTETEEMRTRGRFLDSNHIKVRQSTLKVEIGVTKGDSPVSQHKINTQDTKNPKDMTQQMTDLKSHKSKRNSADSLTSVSLQQFIFLALMN